MAGYPKEPHDLGGGRGVVGRQVRASAFAGQDRQHPASHTAPTRPGPPSDECSRRSCHCTRRFVNDDRVFQPIANTFPAIPRDHIESIEVVRWFLSCRDTEVLPAPPRGKALVESGHSLYQLINLSMLVQASLSLVHSRQPN